MTITTKFDVGQEVWIMHANKPLLSKITGIHLVVMEDSRQGILTGVFYALFAVGQSLAAKHHEGEVFGSKEELIASL